MHEEQRVRETLLRLHAEAETEAGSSANSGLEMDTGLAKVVIGDLGEAGVLPDAAMIPFEEVEGRNRARVLAYSFPEESSRLELVNAFFVSEPETKKVGIKDLRRLAKGTINFLRNLLDQNTDQYRESIEVWDAVRSIGERLDDIEEVRILLIANGLLTNREKFNDIEIDGRLIEFDVWDAERLARLNATEATRDQIDIQLDDFSDYPVAVLEGREQSDEYETFLLVLEGEVLAKLFDKYGPRLFEFNVRSYLQARGKVNKGLRATLSEEPDRFLAYNNGLTATADEIDVVREHGELVLKRLVGLQIVNGAQTTASIHRAWKLDKLDISKVYVAIKLTKVREDRLSEFVPLIAKYANTQNPVQAADLSSNSDFHVAIERLADSKWVSGETSRWFFERARGSYEVARLRDGTTAAKRKVFDQQRPKSQKFNKTDLAKAWMSYWLKPDAVSLGAQKNYSAFMAEVDERKIPQPDESFFIKTVGILILFRETYSIIRRAKLRSYWANVVTYTVSKLFHDAGENIDFQQLWEQQDISKEMADLLDQWVRTIHAEIIEASGDRNVTEFAKKEECREHIFALSLSPAAAETPECSGTETPVDATEKLLDDDEIEEDLVRRCMSLDPGEWAAVFSWAVQSKRFEAWQLKIMTTLNGYALDGWRKAPSIKQASAVRPILTGFVEAQDNKTTVLH